MVTVRLRFTNSCWFFAAGVCYVAGSCNSYHLSLRRTLVLPVRYSEFAKVSSDFNVSAIRAVDKKLNTNSGLKEIILGNE